jgi:hypothetical protein
MDPNFFGAPGTGVHAYRVLNIAIVDALGTLGIAWLVSWVFGISFLSACLWSFGAGIVVHRVVGVRTTMDKLLFT